MQAIATAITILALASTAAMIGVTRLSDPFAAFPTASSAAFQCQTFELNWKFSELRSCKVKLIVRMYDKLWLVGRISFANRESRLFGGRKMLIVRAANSQRRHQRL